MWRAVPLDRLWWMLGKHPRISVAGEPVLTSQSHVRKPETGGLDKGEWTKQRRGAEMGTDVQRIKELTRCCSEIKRKWLVVKSKQTTKPFSVR